MYYSMRTRLFGFPFPTKILIDFGTLRRFRDFESDFVMSV
jgi:hypothetical protein